VTDLPGWVLATTAILAALGGGQTLLSAIKAYRAYKEGVRQREVDADERAIVRLERELAEMRIERAQDADHIRRLIEALGMAGIPIPPRVVGDRDTGTPRATEVGGASGRG
jgi:hypothetical protein